MKLPGVDDKHYYLTERRSRLIGQIDFFDHIKFKVVTKNEIYVKKS